MSGLTEFLLARLAEDEAAATEADARYTEITGGASWALPARALAEVEAKRRIVEEVEVADNIEADLATVMETSRAQPFVGERILRTIAAVYADHPDYSSDWRSD